VSGIFGKSIQFTWCLTFMRIKAHRMFSHSSLIVCTALNKILTKLINKRTFAQKRETFFTPNATYEQKTPHRVSLDFRTFNCIQIKDSFGRPQWYRKWKKPLLTLSLQCDDITSTDSIGAGVKEWEKGKTFLDGFKMKDDECGPKKKNF
jgi:hypothetical protein